MCATTDAQQQWNSWHQAFVKISQAWTAKIDVPYPDRRQGRMRMS